MPARSPETPSLLCPRSLSACDARSALGRSREELLPSPQRASRRALTPAPPSAREEPALPSVAACCSTKEVLVACFSGRPLIRLFSPRALPAPAVSLLAAPFLHKTNDYCAIPHSLKDQVSERYPGARRAIMKSGGDFPFLSRPDEVNLYLQLHLRRVGVEAKQDQISGTSNDGSAGSLYDDKHGKHEEEPPEGRGSSGSHSESHEPQSSNSAEKSHDTNGNENDDGPSEDQGNSDLSKTCSLEEQFLSIISMNQMALAVITLFVHASSSILLMIQLNLKVSSTANTFKA